MKQTQLPLDESSLALLSQLTPLQQAWLSGYCWAKANGSAAEVGATAAENVTAAPLNITILSASQTGNAKGVATKLHQRLQQQGLNATLVSAKEYKAKTISQEQILLLVTSTQGEGEPPEEAIVLSKLLNGKKAPKLDQLQFAVFGLGDTSYPKFCQAGKDFDQRLAELGGSRLLERVDADLDFHAAAEQWIEQISQVVAAKSAAATPSAAAVSLNDTPTSGHFSKENPYSAALLTNQKITGRGSDKDVRHIELDLGESGLRYQAGDALGVWFDNDPKWVETVLTAAAVTGEENVNVGGQTLPLREALLTKVELSQNTPNFVKAYAQLADNAELNEIVNDNETLADYVQCTPLFAVLQSYPAALAAQALVELFRPLTPRLYSIASAQAEVEQEVHLCVGVVRYQHNGEDHTGAASGYLADRLGEDGNVRVFVERNDHFRLPSDESKAIIMIGSGTGIAPFRTFVQQRAADQASGQNWLIFGNPHFSEDFLYQTEWQQFAKDGYLHRYDFAWSRDQAEKIYVQHKIRQQAEGIWQWLEQGAYLYVCGDASRMAKDVEQALLEVIAEQGKLSADEADDYLNNLREANRYQRDVY